MYVHVCVYCVHVYMYYPLVCVYLWGDQVSRASIRAQGTRPFPHSFSLSTSKSTPILVTVLVALSAEATHFPHRQRGSRSLNLDLNLQNHNGNDNDHVELASYLLDALEVPCWSTHSFPLIRTQHSTVPCSLDLWFPNQLASWFILYMPVLNPPCPPEKERERRERET
jgi:hypothetical protein